MKLGLLALLLIVLQVNLAGCCRPSETTAEQKGPEVQGILFREGKGLEIPDATKISLQLKLSEVSEGELRSTFSRRGQIYKSNNASSAEQSKTAFASLILTPSDAEKIEVNDPVNVDDADSGTVTSIDRSALSATGQIEVLVAIKDSNKEHKVGNSVEVKFHSEAKRGVTLIPKSALLETVNGTVVYVPNGKYFFKTAVTIGATDDESVEVTDGLYPGDEVVSHSVMSLWLAELQATKGGSGCADGN